MTMAKMFTKLGQAYVPTSTFTSAEFIHVHYHNHRIKICYKEQTDSSFAIDIDDIADIKHTLKDFIQVSNRNGILFISSSVLDRIAKIENATNMCHKCDSIAEISLPHVRHYFTGVSAKDVVDSIEASLIPTHDVVMVSCLDKNTKTVLYPDIF
jgi:hypothetical protein